MKTKIILLLSLLAKTCISCSQTVVSDNNTFTSEWHNYTIVFPNNWSAEKRPDENKVYLVGPKTDSLLFSRDGAFGILVFALPEAFTSKYTYEQNMESFRTDPIYRGFSIISKKKMLIDNKKAIRVIHSAVVFGTEILSLQYYLALTKNYS